MICPVPSAPPGPLIPSISQLPEIWLAFFGAALIAGLFILAVVHAKAPAHVRRTMRRVLITGGFLAIAGEFVSVLVVMPWQTALGDWYAPQRDLLARYGCPLATLNTLNSQFARWVALVDLLGGTLTLGGVALMVVWGIRYVRASSREQGLNSLSGA